MSVALEEKTHLRQIGNSLGVIIPATIRKSGSFCAGDEVSLYSPYPGVITINSIKNTNKDKIENWNKLQNFVSMHKVAKDSWPKDKTFKELLNEARDERFGL